MNAVDAANKAEIDMIQAVLAKKFGQLYADIWKVGVNLSLRISDLLTLKYADLNLEERSPGGFRLMLESCVPCRMVGMTKRALAHRLRNSSAVL